MKQLRWVVIFSISIMLALPPAALAQSNITTGTIQGTVLDPSGAVVNDAKVEVKNLDTNFNRTVETDSDGRFVFLQLQSGRYTVTVTKQGFATLVQANLSLSVGQTIPLTLTMKVSQVEEKVTIESAPTIDTVKTEASSVINERSVTNTPVLGRKFEDLLTLTPGVSVVQGPDGDEITFSGQRGIFNNFSLDGGDYNNGFFGEQLGGQRAAIDIPLDAIKEFQVVATGASAEFGRTAGGVINVISKSGTNDIHGSAFYFQRLEGLTANTSDDKPLKDFHREQFGGTIGGPIVRDKMFFFTAFEQIFENLTRPNLSEPIGSPCPVSNPTIRNNEGLINSNADCQRLALVNFIRATRNQEEGNPVERPVRNSAFLFKYDWNLTDANKLSASYNFDYSKNTNQTFDVATYGNSANGTEGPSKINKFNINLFTSFTATILNEAHFSYTRENRPRSAVESNVPPDTAIGGFFDPSEPTFRFGNPFFLAPNVDEIFWRTQIKDNVSIIKGKHNIKFGGDWTHSLNDQIFRGFFEGRYFFDNVTGFLRYASPSSLGPGFGPNAGRCPNGSFTDLRAPSCQGAVTPLLLYIQGAGRTGPATDAAGASSIDNEEFALFAQDKWQLWSNFSLSYGLRWEAQIFPEPTVNPQDTAYGKFLNDPRFPSDGTLPDQKKMFQPRVGFAWDLLKNSKSVLRASWGIYNARQNMLSQVGSITTNGVQQQTINGGLFNGGAIRPTWPGVVTPTAQSCGSNPFPCGSGVRVFARDYANPRIYTANVAFEQEIGSNMAIYFDFTHSKGVHLTRFLNFNRKLNASGTPIFGPELGEVQVTSSPGKSLYRGFTAGFRKRFSNRFQLEANYVVAKDLDDDSNERDPFTDRSFNINNLSLDYALSDRDIRHKFNFYTFAEIGWGFQFSGRVQARSAQPITPGARTATNRNTARKDNEYFSFDWRLLRPFHVGENFQIIPIFELFNTFNNDNNINPLTTPGLFNFDGFLRVGVGDPRQAQLAVKFVF